MGWTTLLSCVIVSVLAVAGPQCDAEEAAEKPRLQWREIQPGSGEQQKLSLEPDRIAVVRDGKMAYLSATRVNLPVSGGGGGACRYIRRASNGDLYIIGAAMGHVVHSSDEGRTWESWPLAVENLGHLAAFTILDDDTFLIVASGARFLARSTDMGKTWEVNPIELDLSPHTRALTGNSDLLQLQDGTVLLTLDLRAGPDAVHDESGELLPVELRGSFPYVFFSHDGGRTWPEKSLLVMYAGEVHLLELPDGKLMAAIRKQRWHRLPGDPASVAELKHRYGHTPACDSGIIDAREQSNRIKNMFVSESYDGGHTWVNERQVAQFKQCSGDLTLTSDGTLVLQFLHRYDDNIAMRGIRAMVSYDLGKTWQPELYVIGQGDCYPTGIAMSDGSLITTCTNMTPGYTLQVVRWRPLAKESQE